MNIRVLRPLVLLLYLAGTLYFVLSLARYVSQEPPWDYTVNWVAAQGMRQGISLYSSPQLHHLALSLTGEYAETLFKDPFNSYIGPPSTALLLLPFTFLPFAQSVAIYRVLTILLLATSVYLAGLSLPASGRFAAWSAGGLSLLFFQPVLISVGLGQVDAFVMVALAAGMLAASRGRWWLAGGALGFAALLKISPALLLVYLLLRGKYRAVLGATITVVALLAVAALVGSPSDLWVFLTDIVPSLSAGSLHEQNQSLPAWLARIFSPDADFLTFGRGLGPFSLIGLPLAGVATLVYSALARNRPIHRLDYALLILVALLAGPITWDHYTSWAILALVLLGDGESWRALAQRDRFRLLCGLGVAAILMAAPTFTFSQEEIFSSPWLRLLTGTKTVALLLILGAVLYMLIRSRHASHGADMVASA